MPQMSSSTATRSTNTLDEFIRKMLHLISDAKASPDIDDQRDLPFLVGLETDILQFIRQPLEQAGMQTGEGSPMAPDMNGMMGGGGPPGPPGLGQPMSQGLPPELTTGGGGVPALRNTPPTEGMAEQLRRAINQPGA